MAILDTIAGLGKASSYNDVISAATSVGTGVGGWIKNIKSLTNDDKKDSNYIRDLYLNGFLSQNSYYRPEHFARAFDEPTYLTFKVEFTFKNPYRNIKYNNNGALGDIESAMYNTMYDYMPEPFLEEFTPNKSSAQQTSLYANGMYNGDSSTDIIGSVYSTEQYLDFSLGDHGRASMLHTFRDALKDIQNVFPYYLKSISGLGNLTKVDSTQGIRLKNATIELTCMEGLDLKITQLLNLYRKIVWDDVYQRWILPDMMRYFNMKIYISEIRLFHDFRKDKMKANEYLEDFTKPEVRNASISKKDESGWNKFKNGLTTATAVANNYLGTKSHLTKAINYAQSAVETGSYLYDSIGSAIVDLNMCNSAFNEVMPTICLDCHMCEFDISSTMSHLDSLQSAKTSSPEPKITIKVGQVTETHSYPLNASLRSDSSTGRYKSVPSQHKYDATDIESVYKNRDSKGSLGYIGNFISDDALKTTSSKNELHQRLEDYNNELSYYVSNSSNTPETSINYKARYRKTSDDVTDIDMVKSRNATPDSLARASLMSAGMQEAMAIASGIGKWTDPEVMSYIIGTHSTATSPDKTTRETIEAIGETLNGALDRIYEGVNSMALSPKKKNELAQKLFDDYLAAIYKLDGNGNVTNIIEGYRSMASQKDPNSTEKEILSQFDIKGDDDLLSSTATRRDSSFEGVIISQFDIKGDEYKEISTATQKSDAVEKQIIKQWKFNELN